MGKLQWLGGMVIVFGQAVECGQKAVRRVRLVMQIC